MVFLNPGGLDRKTFEDFFLKKETFKIAGNFQHNPYVGMKVLKPEIPYVNKPAA